MAESFNPYKGQRNIPNLFGTSHENRVVRAVPLVYYVGPVRHTVGKAILREDGTFTATIDQIHQMKVKQLLEEQSLAAMSFTFDSPQEDPALD